jgi:S-adenosylmethionine decarboxylase
MGEAFRVSMPVTSDCGNGGRDRELLRQADTARTLETVIVDVGGDVSALRPETDGADHFVERDGMRFAGTHLIIDLWQAANLDNLAIVEKALRDGTDAAGATLLNIDLHHFTPNGGISGVAVLAESHISIHTWPERAYAAVDIFMCGDAQPHKAIEVLREAFTPGMLTVAEHKRGVAL